MRAAKLGVTVVLLLPLSVLGGCVHQRPHPPLAHQAVGFNLTVEQAQNEMLLLNVIRAKDRLPMYLTAISSLNGNLNSGLTAGLGGSYTHATGDTDTVGGSDSATTAAAGSSTTVASSVSRVMNKTITRGLSPSLGASLSRNPSFTLAVLDGEKFTRGFLAPIDPRTFAYLWDQGWPPELLLYLLVQKVEVGDDVLLNYPPNTPEFELFGAWVRELLGKNVHIVHHVKRKPIGPLLEEKDVKVLSSLISVSKEGLVVSGPDRDERYRLEGQVAEFCINDRNDERCPGRQAGEAEPGSLRVLGSGARSQDETLVDTRIVLRSPEAMLYYLGELMRVADYSPGQARPREVPHVCIQDEWQPLFVAVRAGDCRNPDPFVVARSPWGDYAIPRSETSSWEPCTARGAVEHRTLSRGAEDGRFCAPGRSMQALRLLSQLISLQKSAEELPSPALVRVIGD